jgi:hypothetical protein
MSKGLKHTGRRLVALAAAAGILGGGFYAGSVLAAENEVRMPVSKTVRLAPVGDAPEQDAAKPAEQPAAKPAEKSPEKLPEKPAAKSGKAAEKPAKPADKAAKAEKAAKVAEPDKAPKAVLGKAAEAAAASAASAHKTVTISNKAAPAKAAKPVAKKNVKTVEVSADPDAQSNASAEQAVPTAEAQAAPKAPKAAHSPAQLAAPVVKMDPKASVMPAAPAATGTGTPLPADGLWLGDVSVEYQEQSVIVRIATSKPVEHLSWFNQAEPRKLAADFHGEWRKKGGHVLRFDTGPLKNIIVGQHPDRMRLAVEFRDGAVKPDLEPKLETTPEGVTLTIPLAVQLKR